MTFIPKEIILEDGNKKTFSTVETSIENSVIYLTDFRSDLDRLKKVFAEKHTKAWGKMFGFNYSLEVSNE